MDFESIKKNAPMFAENFPGNIKIYLFGSRAREAVAPSLISNKNDAFKIEFQKIQDTDLLFEVDTEIFTIYKQKCYDQSIGHLKNIPLDAHNCFWDYRIPGKIRLLATMEVLQINTLGMEKIRKAFNNMRGVDIIILPFDWRKNEEIMRIINSYDPNFSRSLKKNAPLLFEKKDMEILLPDCNSGNGNNCCKNSGKIHADCKCAK